jgi:hypothetical protein
MMRTAASLPEQEVDLNRELCRNIRRALWELRDSDEGFDRLPHFDALNQPDMNDETRATREYKRPDFQWELKDSQARTDEDHFRLYAMECKRLGLPSSPTWVLNREYISHGVCRFIKIVHGYGSPKSNSSYAMVGYVQSMDLDDILGEVNGFARTYSVPNIILSIAGWQEKDISHLGHQLDRPEIHPTPLTLRHLWLDIRDIPKIPAKKIIRKPRKTRTSRKGGV